MEIFGGFMVMMSILGFFLTVIWFVLPFVVFGIKGKVDRTVELLESLERRLAAMESRLEHLTPPSSSGEDAAPQPSNTMLSPASSEE
jgi:type II secretory pathway component PulJ